MKEHPKTAIGSALAAPLIVAAAPAAIGFSATGIVANSIAAKLMSLAAVQTGLVGYVATGAIAGLQSAGAAGLATSTLVAASVAGAAGGSAAAEGISQVKTKAKQIRSRL